MRNKKIGLLIISFVLTCLFLVAKNSVNLDICESSDYSCRSYLDMYERFLSPSYLLLFFSLLTYTLSDAIFSIWWKFARWAIPAVFALVILINLRLHHTPGGWLNMDVQIDSFLMGVVYGVFVLGAIISIVRGYKSKK